MSKYSNIIIETVRQFIDSAKSFDVQMINAIIEKTLEKSNKPHESIDYNEIKTFLVSYFENGNMPGYCLTTRPIVDDNGPKMILEFMPNNPFSYLDIIIKPNNAPSVKCTIHPEYKELIKLISEKIGCAQETTIRSILIKALDLIDDQLR